MYDYVCVYAFAYIPAKKSVAIHYTDAINF